MKKRLLLLILSFFSAQGLAASCPDGSKPVKSVSLDGSYYEYKCSADSKESNSSTQIGMSEVTVPGWIEADTMEKICNNISTFCTSGVVKSYRKDYYGKKQHKAFAISTSGTGQSRTTIVGFYSTGIQTVFPYDKDIATALELPPIKLHCSVLAEASIKKAIEDWENKKSVKAALFQPVS